MQVDLRVIIRQGRKQRFEGEVEVSNEEAILNGLDHKPVGEINKNKSTTAVIAYPDMCACASHLNQASPCRAANGHLNPLGVSSPETW